MGFIAIDEEIYLSPRLSLADISVYIALRYFRNRTTALCCPKMETLAKYARVSLNTAYKSRKKLRSLGVITWASCRGRGKRCEYILLLVDGNEEEKKGARDNLTANKIPQNKDIKDGKIPQNKDIKDPKILPQTGNKILRETGKKDGPVIIEEPDLNKTTIFFGGNTKGGEAPSQGPLKEKPSKDYSDEVQELLFQIRLKLNFEKSKYHPVWRWAANKRDAGVNPHEMEIALEGFLREIKSAPVKNPAAYLDSILMQAHKERPC